MIHADVPIAEARRRRNTEHVPEQLKDILGARDERYGDFRINSQIYRDTMRVWQSTDKWEELDAVYVHALSMIATKIARALSHDPTYKDSWLDIMGYCSLILTDIDRGNS